MADPDSVGGASLRLVLVHLLAQFPDTLQAIAEGADKDLKSLEQSADYAENYLVPYRQEVDEILSRALQIARQRES